MVAAVIISVVTAWQLGVFNKAPVVTGVSADVESASVRQAVTFTATASDPDGSIVSYGWNFGDGIELETQVPKAVHSYELPGNFIVLLTVKDNVGAASTNDNNLTYVDVRLPQAPSKAPGDIPPPVALGAVDNQVPIPGQKVNFNGNSSWQWIWTGSSWDRDTASIPTYRWDFGDGSTPITGNLTTGASVNHTYQKAGNWFSKLTIESGNGTSSYGMTIRASKVTLGVKNPSIFTKATFGEPQWLDPAIDYETAGGEVLLNVYETPFGFKGESTSDLVPLLVTEVPSIANGGISPDGTNYNFMIRAGVKFHDGNTLTADDVAYSWKRPIIIHDPEGASWMMDFALFNYLESSYVGNSVLNYTKDMVASGFPPPQWLNSALNKSGHSNVDETVIRDVLDAAIFVNTTAGTPTGTVGVVTMRLIRPYPALLKIAAFTVMDVVEKAYVEAHGGTVWETQNLWMNEHEMGTGPFQLLSWQKNQVIILTRFDGYWQGPAKLKQVNIQKVADITTRELMLFSGQADYGTIPRNHQNDVQDSSGAAKPGLLISKDKPTFIVNFLGFNQKINKTQTVDTYTNVPTDFFAGTPGSSGWHVRRAFSYAFDYNTFLSNILFGGGIRSNGPIPAGMFGFSNVTLFNYDLNAAKAELQASTISRPAPAGTAGAACPAATNWYDCGFNMRLYYNIGNLVRQNGLLLLKQSLESLAPGRIQIDVVGLDWPVFLTTTSSKHKIPALFFLGWAPDYADPDDYAAPFLDSYAGVYPARVSYSNTSLNLLIEKAAIEVDQTKRAQDYAEIQKIAYETDVPYLWTHQSVTFDVFKSWVKGFVSNPMTTANQELLYYDLSKG